MTDDLERAVAAGRDFIVARQAPDGSWTDWDLPPGSSSIWTTAYVGWRLHQLPPPLRANVPQAVSRAARWLLDRQFHDGGWGYNETVGSDADSTAFCVLLLDAVGDGAPASAVDHLLSYQQRDGGFATYRPDGAVSSWMVSHPDVTPVALLALLPHLGIGDARIRKGIACVLREQNADGAWGSFWWNSFLYGTDASLSLLRMVGIRSRRPIDVSHVEPTNAFQTALLLSCAMNAATEANLAIERRIARLIRKQRPDGSWTSAPALRITRRDCFEPWTAADPGPLFADPHRLFTSATVLGALAHAHAHAPVQRRSAPERSVSAVA